MPDYIPGPDTEFDLWAANFKTYFAANAVPLGFTAADATALTNAFNAWHTSLTDHSTAVATAKGLCATKDTHKKTTKAVIRGYAQRIQTNPATTDIQRAALGITIKDTTRTPAQTPTEAPYVVLDWSNRGRVVIHAGTNPQNESRNKMGPYGKNLLFQFRTTGGEWEFLAVTSTSPFVHVVGNNNALVLEYRAAYLNTKGDMGPWSSVETAYVAAAA